MGLKSLRLHIGPVLFLLVLSVILPVLLPAGTTKLEAVGGGNTLFMEPGSDADQAVTRFYNNNLGTGCVSSTAQQYSGPRSIACTDGTGYSSVGRTNLITNGAGRFTAYFRFGTLPNTQAAFLGKGNTDNFNLAVGINSSGKLIIVTSSANTYTTLATGTTTLSINTWYRVSLTYEITSSTVNEARVYLNGNQEVSELNGTLSTNFYPDIAVGWLSSPGATGGNKTIYVDNIYADDSAGLADTGDVLVTAKLPNTVNNNSFNTTGGTGAVNERPLSETNNKSHTATSTVAQDYNIQTLSVGDVDLTGKTILSRQAWIWAKKGSGGAGSPKLIAEGVDNTITLGTSYALFTVTNDGSSYPTQANAIGMKSSGAAADTFLAEAGMLIAYSPNISITASDGSISYGILNTNTAKDTTSGGLNDTQTATNNGGQAEDFNIKGQSSASWTLAGSAGSEQYKHEFCTSGSGSPDPCDSGPTWTALTTSYQSLATNIAASGTKKFDLKVTTPTSTAATAQQSVSVTVQAVAH